MAEEGNAGFTEHEMNASASQKEKLTRRVNPWRSGTSAEVARQGSGKSPWAAMNKVPYDLIKYRIHWHLRYTEFYWYCLELC
jgi:hypothetical protein